MGPCARPVKFPQPWKTHVKEQCPVKVSWAPFITIGGYIVIIHFTGRHWLLLASSKLQSSPVQNDSDNLSLLFSRPFSAVLVFSIGWKGQERVTAYVLTVRFVYLQWQLLYYLPISSPCPAAERTYSKSGDKMKGIPFNGIILSKSTTYTEFKMGVSCGCVRSPHSRKNK